MPADSSSRIVTALSRLGDVIAEAGLDLVECSAAVPDPRDRRGRWHRLSHILAVCAAAMVSGAKHLSAVAVDGKSLPGAKNDAGKAPHLLSVVRHGDCVTLAQTDVDSKTNETTRFQPLLAAVDLAGIVVTADALHTLASHARWLVDDKKAHYIAIAKRNQPTLFHQLARLPWKHIPAGARTRDAAHGRDVAFAEDACRVTSGNADVSRPSQADH